MAISSTGATSVYESGILTMNGHSSNPTQDAEHARPEHAKEPDCLAVAVESATDSERIPLLINTSSMPCIAEEDTFRRLARTETRTGPLASLSSTIRRSKIFKTIPNMRNS